mgnify:CR=1 FL=1
MATFTAACVQINASNDLDKNLASLGTMIREARDMGADFITTPECAAMIEVGRKNIRHKSFVENEHPALAAFQDWAKETGAWLLAGSLSVLLEDEERLANRQFLIGPTGKVTAKYDKIHMFDVAVDDNQGSYFESKVFEPGEKVVTINCPLGCVGLTVCYDIRFPELYLSLIHI